MKAFSVALLVIYTLFLVMGGFAFMYLEFETEESVIMVEEDEWKILKEILFNPNLPEKVEEVTIITNLELWLQSRCPELSENTFHQIKKPGNQSQVAVEIMNKCTGVFVEVTEIKYHYPWNFIDALYFAMTVATTIGYGHISPSTALGRIVCMIYAILGIPLTMILLSLTSNFFGERLYLLFETKLDKEKRMSKFFIALGTIFYISIGFVIFIFLPAIIFMRTENWTYLEGVYFAFITLTTIGFGDFVTGKSMEGHWMYVYQIAVILWIMSGLGYWVMVANFMTRALRSKKMQTFAKKATDIKKLMNQVGITHQDPKFLSQHSKATINLMMQLSRALAMPEIAFNDGEPSNMAPHTPSTVPGISSLFGKSGLGGIMASMASTTGRVCPQSEVLNNKVQNKVASDNTERLINIQESSKIIDSSSPLKQRDVDINIEYPARSSNHFFKQDQDLPSAKSSRNSKLGIASTPSANNLMGDFTSREDEEEIEVVQPKDANEYEQEGSSDLQVGIEINFSPTSAESNHAVPSIYKVDSDSELWKNYDSFSIRL